MIADEAYCERFAILAGALADGKTDHARQIVQEIANLGAQSNTKRSTLSLRRRAGLFARDSYTCRYCERRTIAEPVLRIVSNLFPETFRFHPSWKTSETDAAYFLVSTSLDHVVPVTRDGSDNSANLVTTCSLCNYAKSNYLLSELRGWSIKEPRITEWRGLTEYLDAMMTKAGFQNDPYLRRWRDATLNPEPVI